MTERKKYVFTAKGYEGGQSMIVSEPYSGNLTP